jgi:acetyl esterase
VRVYHPSPGDTLPVLMYMHGGGWSIGGVWTSDEACRVLATRVPCVVVSVEYRLAPEHKFPAAFDDAYHVATWLAKAADEIGGDPARIAVGGDSAGANLAAAVSVHARDEGGPRILAQVLAYPMTKYDPTLPSLTENADAPMLKAGDVSWFLGQYLRGEADRTDPRALPANAASLAGLPPALILTAEYDPLRDDGEAFGQALTQAGTPATVTRYPGAFHGFFTMTNLNRGQQALADAAAYLAQAFGTAARRP